MENKVTSTSPNGIVTEYREDGDKFSIIHKQKTLPIKQGNYEMRKDKGRWKVGSDEQHIARIPLVTYMLWESAGITQDPAEFSKALKRHRDEVMTTTKNI